jgi:sec-independent protein translocase protein TatB
MFVSTVHIQLSLAFMSAHPPILLGTMSMVDSLILMVMALVVFGPRRLPQIGRQIGKLMYEFRKASNDFKFQMEEELRNAEDVDRRKKEEERQRSLAALAATEQASVSADPPAKTLELPPAPVVAESEPYPPDTSEARASEESVPRIMPPSTGETVAAARPGRVPESSTEMPTESSPATTSQSSTNTDESGANLPQSADSAEALNQHG